MPTLPASAFVDIISATDILSTNADSQESKVLKFVANLKKVGELEKVLQGQPPASIQKPAQGRPGDAGLRIDLAQTDFRIGQSLADRLFK